jgi:hypothetical protein
VVSNCEFGNETLASIKYRKFDELRSGYLLKKYSAAWSK